MRGLFLFGLFLLFSYLAADSISEKIQSLPASRSYSCNDIEDNLRLFNEELRQTKLDLKALFNEVRALNQEDASDERFLSLLQQIQKKKYELSQNEERWQARAADWEDDESYALMHAPKTTVEELIIDYGCQDFLYLIPEKIASMQLSLCSALPIPRSSWTEILELLLVQNGIGVKQLNPYVKSLYAQTNSTHCLLEYITNQEQDLEVVPPLQRVCFILSPDYSNTQRAFAFLNQFSDATQVTLQLIGKEIVMISTVENIKDLLKLYHFIQSNQQNKAYQLVALNRIAAKEMHLMLEAYFIEKCNSHKSGADKEYHPLTILPLESLSNHLFLMGSKQDLEKAQAIIEDIESRVASPHAMTIDWYTCKYSDPDDLATVLDSVYQVLLNLSVKQEDLPNQDSTTANNDCKNRSLYTIPPICDTPELVVNPKPVEPKKNPPFNEQTRSSNSNFIVDAKTGMIIMVVEQRILPQLKDLIKKIDVPKKMIRLEVLLFEKKVTDQTQFGLNLLQLGDAAKNQHLMGLQWGSTTSDTVKGILDFFFSREKTNKHMPAYNFAYRFLISQEDVRIHSSPSITAVNQTPAVIELVEEQSIDMGTVEDPKTSTVSKTFVRAQYGIFIQITPTINIGDETGETDQYITLDTSITFDTVSSKQNDRPNVARRHIQNQVRIPNGQTVILGGLRRKTTEEGNDKIPFLGDIPGVGKLFSFATKVDKTTEMFIFITPQIIFDPVEDYERIRREELKKRPGDTPEFLEQLLRAQELKKSKELYQACNSILT